MSAIDGRARESGRERCSASVVFCWKRRRRLEKPLCVPESASSDPLRWPDVADVRVMQEVDARSRAEAGLGQRVPDQLTLRKNRCCRKNCFRGRRRCHFVLGLLTPRRDGLFVKEHGRETTKLPGGSRDVARSAYFKDSRCRIARSSASSSEPRMTSSFSSIVARCPGESDVCGSTC